jgi:crotonobetainyl-CoA:carnitine CoA-transferase CaiB-like acyl-CoA transferase
MDNRQLNAILIGGPVFLNSFRVIDITDERGLLAGHILAELGADVIQVEPLAGSSARRVDAPSADARAAGAPSADARAAGTPAGECSFFWSAYASGKRGATCNLQSDGGRELFLRLLSRADCLIESAAPGELARLGLDHQSIRSSNATLIHASITAFGSSGPKSQYAASDLIAWAAGGALWPSRDGAHAPLRISVPQAYLHAAADAAGAVLIAQYARTRSGRGQHIDVSAQQSVAQATLSSVLSEPIGHPNFSIMAGAEPAKKGGAKQLDLSGSGARTRRSRWRVRDGLVEMHLAMGPAAGRFTNNLFAWLRDSHATLDARFLEWDWITIPQRIQSGEVTDDDLEAVRSQLAAHLAGYGKRDLLEVAIARKFLLAPIFEFKDLAESPHNLERGTFVTLEDSAGRRRTTPGPFVRARGLAPPAPRAAPSLGEHDQEVYAEIGLTARELAAARADGLVR